MPIWADLARRWSLRRRLLLFFIAIVAGGIAVIALGLWVGYGRVGRPDALPGFVIAGVIAGFGLFGMVAGIWLLFDDNVAKPIARIAADLRARAHSGVDRQLDTASARYLGDLGEAASAIAADLAETRGALATSVARETERIATENVRLAAILRDVQAGVILCTGKHRIVLYNAQAVRLLATVGELGLDRSLFGLMRPGPIKHAYERLSRAPGQDHAHELVCATADGRRVLQGQMRLVVENGGAPGYVLTLRDATVHLSAHAQRERLLAEVVEYVRRPAANLKTTLDVLADQGLIDRQRDALQAAVVNETQGLVDWIDGFARRVDDERGRWWPMSDVAAGDIADALTAYFESHGMTAQTRIDPLVLHCDGFAIVRLLGDTVRGLPEPPRSVTIAIRPDGPDAMIEIGFEGPVPPVEAIETWLTRPLAGSYADFTGRDVLNNHRTDLWPEPDGAARALLRLPIPDRQRDDAPARPDVRSEFYDFALLDGETADLDDDRELDALQYVVFDTETTGLMPLKGDRVVQLAAVRIVNGRILHGENLDLLVDPGRPIPAASTRFHRITDEMVRGAPTIAQAGRRFHQFAADAILVAHNAPFDMAFLRRDEAEIGARFTNPVLDTVVLSAILFGLSEDHSLDAVAERFGVALPDEIRHTAIGDAEATARVFLKMVPMLTQAGYGTLGGLMREIAKYRRRLAVTGRKG